MANNIKNRNDLYQTKFSFGMTSAIVTNLALITGLDTSSNAKVSIIAGILVIAFADNISDSLGIHVFQESECIERKKILNSTLTNFAVRVFVSLVFVFLIAFLPISLAVICSIIWGLGLLSLLSYIIAKDEGVNPYLEIFKHVGIAVLVIFASKYLGRFIQNRL